MNRRLIIKLIIGILIIVALGLAIFIVSAEIAAAPGKQAVVATLPPNQAVPAVTIAALPEAPIVTTMIFGGDVMLSRNVNSKMIKYADWTWPFLKIAPTMSSADLTIVNLESPFTIAKDHTVKTGSFSFNADPRSSAGLKLAGIDIVSLANNHAMNQGAKGIRDTATVLAENNILSVGAGLDSAAAHRPAIQEINGMKFGFLGYAYPDDYSVAASTTAGIADMDIGRMKEDVKQLSTRVDVVIVLMHAGIEYINKPNKQQTEFARAAIDAGADLVVGHHPHWAQTTEIYQGKPILYSLGNLVFDQMWSQETQEGALAEISWTGDTISNIKIIPIGIRDYGQAFVIADEKQKARIMKQMGLAKDTIDL